MTCPARHPDEPGITCTFERGHGRVEILDPIEVRQGNAERGQYADHGAPERGAWWSTSHVRNRFDARYCNAVSGAMTTPGSGGRPITCTEPPGHGPVRDPEGQAWMHAAAEVRCWWGVLEPAVPAEDIDLLARQLREVADQCADVVLAALERHRLEVEEARANPAPWPVPHPTHPLQQLDRQGRPMLADVLAARAQALAALMHLAVERR